MIKRRKFLIAFGLSALATPLVSMGQPPPGLHRIGYLVVPSSNSNARLQSFKQGLLNLGYVEGKNFLIEYRSAEGKIERFPALAAELVRLEVEVIVADDGSPSTIAAAKATRTIPIVFTTVADPVGQGIVASLARPGGNVTGLSLQIPDTSGKRLEFLKALIPGARRIAVLANPSNVSSAPVVRALHASATTLGMELLVVEAQTLAEFDGAFAEMTRQGVAGLVIIDDPVLYSAAGAPQLAILATKLKLPTISGNPLFPRVGGLASYGPNRLAMLRRAAALVDKTLRGVKPADLPIEQPSELELIVNLKAAKALGIEIPKAVLFRADEVIE